MSFRLSGTEAVPDIGYEESLIWEKVKPGPTIYGSFNVCNVGESDSFLDWYILSSPAWGTWTFIPKSEPDLQAGDSYMISVKVTAPAEKNAEFTGVIKVINLGDPTDYCEVPVVMKTPQNQNVYFQLFFVRLFELYPDAFPLLRQMLG